MKGNDGPQVTGFESHFALPASDVGGRTGWTDADWRPIATNVITTKRNKRTTALLTVSRCDRATRRGGVLRGEAAEPA
jgi:hypothetical protein